MGGQAKPRIDGTSTDDLVFVGFEDTDGDRLGNTSGTTYDVYTYGGDDTIFGGDGNERIYAEDGNDFVIAGNGQNRVYGGDGNDVVLGGDDRDYIWGDAGDDLLNGGGGNDIIRTGKGSDTVLGGAGNDKIYGNGGRNDLRGGEGNDTLNSGDNTSVLDGGADNDILEIRMRKGADHVATGGTGADEFKFQFAAKAAVSEVTVTDFALGEDSFSVDGVDASVYLAGLDGAAVTSQGGDALLTLTSGDTVLFQNVTEAEFESFFGL